MGFIQVGIYQIKEGFDKERALEILQTKMQNMFGVPGEEEPKSAEAAVVTPDNFEEVWADSEGQFTESRKEEFRQAALRGDLLYTRIDW